MYFLKELYMITHAGKVDMSDGFNPTVKSVEDIEDVHEHTINVIFNEGEPHEEIYTSDECGFTGVWIRDNK